MRASNKSLWKKGNIFKYLAYFIMSCLAALTLVLPPMFRLADVRQAKIAAKQNTVDIPQSFKVACRAKPFFTTLLAFVLEALIFVAGTILIGLGSGIFGAVGYVITLFVDTVPPMLIIGIFLAPGAIILAVYSVVMALMFAPTAYVVETNPDIGAANAVSICINTMKSRGKWTYFITLFVTFLIEFLILAVGAGVETAVILFVDDVRLSVVLAVLLGIVFFVGFALVAPMFGLARKITVYSL
ncbi:MAG: tubulin-like doman-containing protein, partial [Clostridia bacterium]|nr:tubulin-like doman-containing protein [Clostridia bacterium]